MRPQPAKMAIVARGETQKHVAAQIGYRLATLNLALNGQEKASRPLRQKLSEYLGIPADDLFVDEDKK